MITPLIIILILFTPLSIAYVAARYNVKALDINKFASWGLGIAFIFFSVGHFVKTQGMIEMLPPWIPYRLSVVLATGVVEFVVGLLLFVPAYRVLASRLAIVIFVAFFPANIYAAINELGLGGHQWGPSYLLIRAPLQLLLIVWAYQLCVKPR